MTTASPTDRPAPARRLALRGLCALLGLAPAGCRLTGPDTRYDLLEAEIRTRDEQIECLQRQLNQSRLVGLAYNTGPIAAPASGSVNAPALTLPLKEIVLASGTGGVDEDGRPGDEYLNVTIAPRDEDGTVVKVPMRALVKAYEISANGLKSPLGEWEVSGEQMRKAWRSGLLSSGYFVPLRWDRPPTTERLKIVARVQTENGQVYEADKEVRVRPLPPGLTPVLPVAAAPHNELPVPATNLPPRGNLPSLGNLPPRPPTNPTPEELPPPRRLQYRR